MAVVHSMVAVLFRCFSAWKWCTIALIKAVQGTVGLYLPGLPALWNHWGLLGNHLISGRVDAGDLVWRFTCGFRDLNPAIYSKNYSDIDTAELTDIERWGNIQSFHVSCASIQVVSCNLVKPFWEKLCQHNLYRWEGLGQHLPPSPTGGLSSV